MQTILGIGFVFLCAAVIIGAAYLYIRFYLFRGAKITETSYNNAQITDDDFDELAPTTYTEGATVITGTGEFHSRIP